MNIKDSSKPAKLVKQLFIFFVFIFHTFFIYNCKEDKKVKEKIFRERLNTDYDTFFTISLDKLLLQTTLFSEHNVKVEYDYHYKTSMLYIGFNLNEIIDSFARKKNI